MTELPAQVSYVEASQRLSIIEAVVHLVNRDFVSLTVLQNTFSNIILSDQISSRNCTDEWASYQWMLILHR
jgi:hypothetical protein